MARQLIGAQSVASPREYQRQPPDRGVLAEGEPTRLAVDRLDDAAGEVEVAADQRLDVSRLDAMFPVLGEVSDVPIELMVRGRQSDQPALSRWVGGEPHVYTMADPGTASAQP